MPEILSQSSVIAFPTVYREGLPKALLEAAACARPLVASDIPGCREIVRDGVNGFLVPPRDHAALSDAVHTLLNSPDLRKQFGRASRTLACTEFSVDVVIERTLSLYRRMLS